MAFQHIPGQQSCKKKCEQQTKPLRNFHENYIHKKNEIRAHLNSLGYIREEEVTLQILPLAIFHKFKPILHHIYENGMNLLRINAAHFHFYSTVDFLLSNFAFELRRKDH